LRLDYWHKKNSLLHGISVKNPPEQSVKTHCSMSGGSFILVVLVAQPMPAPKMSPPLSGESVRYNLGQKRTSAGQNGRKNFRCCERKMTKLLVEPLKTLENDDAWDEGSQPTTISPQLNDWATG
jgi:hypothetical protein